MSDRALSIPITRSTPGPLDGHPALQVQPEFDEECDRRFEVVHDDQDVVHALGGHIPVI
jgi:hypothetical protein